MFLYKQINTEGGGDTCEKNHRMVSTATTITSLGMLLNSSATLINKLSQRSREEEVAGRGGGGRQEMNWNQNVGS